MNEHNSDRHKERCQVVRASQTFIGAQGLVNAVGISAETVGAKGINLQIVTVPPRAIAKTHRHNGHETAIYALSGSSNVWWGSSLENHETVGPGDFLYIPAGMAHQPYNDSDTPAVVIIARTDPSDHESVELLPNLDNLHT